MRTGRRQSQSARVIRQPSALESKLFMVLYSMTQGNEMNSGLALLVLILEDVQLLGFAFDRGAGFGSMPNWITYVFNPLSYQPHQMPAFGILFYVAFGLTIVTAALTVFAAVGGSFMKSVSWPLHLLRALTKMLSTVLLIPVFEIFAAALGCSNNDLGCLPHLIAPAVVGVAYLTLEAPMVSLIFLTINPSAKDVESRTTGRVDAVYTLLRIALVAIQVLAYDLPSVRIAAIIVVSGIMVGLTVRYQPYFAGPINDVRTGVFTASLFAGIQSAICYGAGGFDDPAAFIVLCVSMLPAFAIGYAACAWIRGQISTAVYERLEAKRNSPDARDDSDKGSEKWDIEASAASTSQKGSSTFKDVKSIVKDVSIKPIRVFRNVMDVEIACRFLQHNQKPEALALVNAIFDAAYEQFPNSAELTMMRAYYITAYNIGDHAQSYDCLMASKARHPALDIRFFIFFEERTMEQEDRKEVLQTSQLNVTGYAEIMAIETHARHWHLEALLSMKALWEHMKTDKGSVDCIPFLLERLADHRQKADSCYRKMLDKYPNSKQVLRRYSTFLLKVASDYDKAAKLIERAELIENAEQREYTMRSANAAYAQERADKAMSMHRKSLGNESTHRKSFGGNDSVQHKSLGDVVEKSLEDGWEEQKQPPPVMREEPTWRAPPTPPPAPPKPAEENDYIDSGDAGIFLAVPAVPQPDQTGEVKVRRGSLIIRELRDSNHGIAEAEKKSGKDRHLDFASVENEEAGQSSAIRADGQRDLDFSRRAQSAPSITSATSSQREVRQMRYFRTILETRLTSPIQRFKIAVNFASLILLGGLITGCAISLMTYPKILSAINEAYGRMRPRSSVQRMSLYIRQLAALSTGSWQPANVTLESSRKVARIGSTVKIWKTQLMPILRKYHNSDVATIDIKVYNEVNAHLETYNPYFLGSMLVEIADRLSLSQHTFPPPPSLANSREVRTFVDNLLTVRSAYQATAMTGVNDFLNYCSQNIVIAYALVVIIPVIAILTGILILRPMIEKVSRTELQILTLTRSLPRKFIYQNLESIEEEIENMMVEMEEMSEEGIKTPTISGTSGTVPQESVMRGHSKRHMTKMYATGLFLFALTGPLMFVPSIQESRSAIRMMQLLRQVSDVCYWAAGTAAIAVESAQQDPTSWVKGDPQMWLQQALTETSISFTAMLTSDESGPSALEFPILKAFIVDAVVSLFRVFAMRLRFSYQPLVVGRTYNDTIGLTNDLVISPVNTIIRRFIDETTSYLEHPPEEQGFDNPHLQFTMELVEDIIESGPIINQLLVNEVNASNSRSQSINIFLFCLSFLVLVLTYLVAFRCITYGLRQKFISIIHLFFSLPPALIQSTPELKRFLESGGMIMPAADKTRH
ncbi:hypothetical protein HK104_008338 [Borealophlyctis nickersoniae]|nr:hypothetical protein HK104_008338 [Borealophlyctis nickersoniae]